MKRLDAFSLKIIAITAMTLDHIGAFLYPEEIEFRVIGRLAMPIIAYLVVEGYHKTRNLKYYWLRLLGFALLAQPVYMLAFASGLNVLFDLLIGLSTILVIDQFRLGWVKYLLLVVICILAISIGLDWWHLTILMMFIFHQLRGNFRGIALAISALFIVNFLLFFMLSKITGDETYLVTHSVNVACIAALPLLLMYNGLRGLDYRYFFYLYYPAHLLVIYLIKTNYF